MIQEWLRSEGPCLWQVLDCSYVAICVEQAAQSQARQVSLAIEDEEPALHPIHGLDDGLWIGSPLAGDQGLPSFDVRVDGNLSRRYGRLQIDIMLYWDILTKSGAYPAEQLRMGLSRLKSAGWEIQPYPSDFAFAIP